MACTLLDLTGLSAWSAGAYNQGNRVQYNGVKYYAVKDMTTSGAPDTDPNWIAASAIRFDAFLGYDQTAGFQHPLQSQFTVIYDNNASGYYLLLIDIALFDSPIGDTDTFEPIDIECLGILGQQSIEQWDGNETVGQRIYYTDDNVYIKIQDTDSLPSGDFTTLNTSLAGWYQVGAYDPLDYQVTFDDDNPVAWTSSAIFAISDKVYDSNNVYWVSLHNNNQGNVPMYGSEHWEYAHEPVPFLGGVTDENDIPLYNGANAPFTFGELVRNAQDEVYMSLTYQNNALLNDVNSWTLVEQLSTTIPCGNEYKGVWDPQYDIAYDKGDVVSYMGTTYRSLRNNNLQPPTDQTSWKECTGASTVVDPCSPSSVWSTGVFYSAGYVVSHYGITMVATQDNINENPLFSSKWKLCNGSPIVADCSASSLGVWNVNTAYTKDQVVEYKNAYWKALKDHTGSIPGASFSKWVKCADKAIASQDLPDMTGESIVVSTKKSLLYSAVYEYARPLYVRHRGFILAALKTLGIHKLNSETDRLHFFGNDRSFVVKFFVAGQEEFTNTYDQLKVIAHSAGVKFDEVIFETNLVAAQTVTSAMKRYKYREGVHRLPIREQDAEERLRGEYLEITLILNKATVGNNPIRLQRALCMIRISH